MYNTFQLSKYIYSLICFKALRGFAKEYLHTQEIERENSRFL